MYRPLAVGERRHKDVGFGRLVFVEEVGVAGVDECALGSTVEVPGEPVWGPPGPVVGVEDLEGTGVGGSEVRLF